ncbi:MAG TPA: hypothetical protein PLM79_10200 [Syntrophobacteraceae bacterium]|nr:hypothetical protein [Syntrophobacteraceae bacterium]
MEGELRIGTVMDQLAMEVFQAHWSRLVRESSGYLIDAVWGNEASGALTPIQREIHQRVILALDRVMAGFWAQSLGDVPREAIKNLVQEMLVWRLLYAFELFRRRLSEEEWESDLPNRNKVYN